jgi:hypothetical protein
MQNVKSTWISIYLLRITKNETECEIYHLCRSYIKRYQIKIFFKNAENAEMVVSCQIIRQ